ncbi:tRNA (guanine37-N1)-methyltransferase [Ruminococcaceae bacterium YRB3002]|nr:tRNA (guanine37-N1)-methyltransferase [Ruminococcaceae bacterium YRB3002]
MDFYVETLFPEQVDSFLRASITGRALTRGIISLECLNIRDFAVNDYGKVDDTMYGGGTGMLMQCGPVYDCWKSVVDNRGGKAPYTVYVSPKGSVLTQAKARELASRDSLLIICGHYEGIDSRVIDEICDEEISIGDYVLTGGEIAAVTIIDCVSRMIPGVLPSEDAYMNESHMSGTLEGRQFTKPSEWHGRKVPDVLMSGDQAAIDEYNRISALVETWQKRPDMLERLEISEADWEKMLAMQKAL